MKTGAKYRVVLIEEGLGNLGDINYYSREALEFAFQNKVFEGAQSFADHPTKMEDVIRPERSVRDLIGFFEKVAVETGENGTAELRADLCTLEGEEYDWARSLIETALNVAGRFDKDFIGLSINAGGGSIKKDIDDLLADENLPVSVKPKLLKAKELGATEVDYLTELSEAVSCDLVTQAGARGRALKKLVESERNSKMPKVKTKENDLNKNAGNSPGEQNHPDVAKDKELIASMMKKYMGDGEYSEEECAAMKEAYEAAKEMGMEGEEAEKAAGYSMKMAKHSAGKAAEAAAAKEAADAEEAAKKEAENKESTKEKKGMESEVKKLQGQVSDLTKKVRESEVKEFIEKTVSEHGFEGTVAKKFRESIKSSKSEEEVTEKTKIFKEALSIASEEGFIMNPEKQTAFEGEPLSLADCVRG